MSVAAMAWAFQQHVPSTAKLVLLALADHTDDNGNCWPGIAGLAIKCSLTDRSIRLQLKLLAEYGLVSIERHVGRSHTNVYHLTLSEKVNVIQGIINTESQTLNKVHQLAPIKGERRSEKVNVVPQTLNHVQGNHHEPSRDPEDPELAQPRKKSFTKAEIDPVKNELARVTGIKPASPEEWGPIQKAAYIILAAGGIASDVEPRFNNLNLRYEGKVTIKPMTLATRWGEAATAPAIRPAGNGSKPRQGGRAVDSVKWGKDDGTS